MQVIGAETLTDPRHLEVAQQGAGCRAVGARLKHSSIIPFNKSGD